LRALSNARPTSAAPRSARGWAQGRPPGDVVKAQKAIGTDRAAAVAKRNLAKQDREQLEAVALGRTPAPEGDELPRNYRAPGSVCPQGAPHLPEYDLWVTLHGGNGTFAKRKAKARWVEELKQHAARELAFYDEAENQRQKAIDAERRRRLADEELKLRIAEAEKERQRRLQEEERARAQRLEEERRQKEEAERRWRLQQPRKCKACGGSGNCDACEGRGCARRFYFSASVTGRTAAPSDDKVLNPVFGALPMGCHSCGGAGDGACWGEYIPGSGHCGECGGSRFEDAPPGGWPVDEIPGN